MLTYSAQVQYVIRDPTYLHDNDFGPPIDILPGRHEMFIDVRVSPEQTVRLTYDVQSQTLHVPTEFMQHLLRLPRPADINAPMLKQSVNGKRHND